MILFIFSLLFLCFSSFQAETTSSLAFHQLSTSPERISPELASLHYQEVKIRGFLYLLNEKEWVLSSQPDLKTCCVGSKDKISEQVYISPKSPLKQFKEAVVLQGRFLIEPTLDEDGKLIRLYHLENAVLLGKHHSRGYSYLFLIFFLCGSLAFLWKLVKPFHLRDGTT